LTNADQISFYLFCKYVLMPVRRYSSIFNSMDTQLCSTFKHDDVLDASKSNLPIPCLELLN